jgi:hypothetical protein
MRGGADYVRRTRFVMRPGQDARWMRSTEIAAALVMTGITAALIFFSTAAAAQSYRPELSDRSPSLAMSMSPSAIDALNYELKAEFRSMEAFAGSKRGVDRFGPSGASNRPEGWKFYGRFGLLNFQNQLGEQRLADTQVTWRRTGPSLTGRYYIGFHRQFW